MSIQLFYIAIISIVNRTNINVILRTTHIKVEQVYSRQVLFRVSLLVAPTVQVKLVKTEAFAFK